MKQKFNSAIFDPNQTEMVRLDYFSMVLHLNPNIWSVLPSDQNDFVLYHKDGQMILQTTKEYKDLKLPVEHFAALRILSDPDSKKTIRVLSLAETPSNISGFWPFSSKDKTTDPNSDMTTDPNADQPETAKKDNTGLWLSAATTIIGGALQALPLLGVGSASRQAETATAAAGQKVVLDAQAKAAEDAKQIQVIIISVVSGMVVLSIVAYFALRTK